MRVGVRDGRVVGWDEAAGAWVVVGEDMLRFLGGGIEAVREAGRTFGSAYREIAAGGPEGLPLEAGSLRCFALWEEHMINGAKGLVREFGSGRIKRVAGAFERITGRVPAAMRPRANYYRDPQFYLGNHRAFVADGATVEWPSFARVLDFELELGIVIARPVKDCGTAEGRAAIGGFVVVNDWTARDTQWDDTRRGTFGGVVKAKTFANGMSSIVVTADEVLPRWRELTGTVTVNGATWARSSTAGPMFDLGTVVAYAARGEQLRPGDVLSSGTLPGLCGLEIGRFPLPGDEVRLDLDLGEGEPISLTGILGTAERRARFTAGSPSTPITMR
ncbi:fumarylacetoacetase [Actinoplanes sp. OR16]|uniref:fumarylacetoacetate hydrolase family protein n=1 Tax=Actinoplanes sp. OR16 TaxID=946334 RepID=UPI000F6F591C|nr:fumarylacetoacetate hydrolase family protein [Actinoplanes sp. OR16]BBH68200.1 fumarylacetoacetase [Actinoplanes sp. OR16]